MQTRPLNDTTIVKMKHWHNRGGGGGRGTGSVRPIRNYFMFNKLFAGKKFSAFMFGGPSIKISGYATEVNNILV